MRLAERPPPFSAVRPGRDGDEQQPVAGQPGEAHHDWLIDDPDGAPGDLAEVPSAAVAIANIAYLALSFASGIFIPLDSLPSFVRDIAPYLMTPWPTSHGSMILLTKPAPARRFRRHHRTAP
jgi:hypothetical protein